MYRFFCEHYDTVIYDPKLSDGATQEDINKCDAAIVCVPTPVGDDGKCDISIVEETMGWLNPKELIVIKSTVTPGTSEKYLKDGRNVCFSPEYIGEGKYEIQWWKDRGYAHPTDMKKHDFFIFGGPVEATRRAIRLWQRVTGPDKRYIQTTARHAELTKYMENTWGAMKVAFCHEWFNICEAHGVDYETVRELFLLDGRTERMHTSVFEPDKGFDGKCFPKDLSAIIHSSEQLKYEPKILKQVKEVNEKGYG